MSTRTRNGNHARKLLPGIVAVLLGFGQAAHARDPHIDPTLPSSRLPELPKPRTGENGQSLKLPGKPREVPEGEAKPPGTILLKRVLFEGNTLFPAGELEALAQPYLNRRLSGADIEELRYKVTLFYVNHGYLNSGAIVPDQQVDRGELRLKIIEGHLKEVLITDNSDAWRLWPLRDSYYRDRLMGDADRPLNAQELRERYLMLLNDRLIERLNGTLLPGLHPGEAVLDLKVLRNLPYGGYLGVDNYSPPAIGSYTGRLGFWLDNLSGFGERVDFNMSPTGGAFSYNTGIDIPLTASGTRFAFRYTNSETVLVEAPFDVLNIQNNVISYDGQLSHPVLWDLQQKLTLGMNFGVRQNRETLDGIPIDQPGAQDGLTQVTVWRTWQDYLHQGKDFDMAFRSTFSVGLDALGATISPTPQSGDGRFFAWLGQAIGRYRFMDNGAHVSLSGAVQVTGDKLLSLEKIAVGGASTVRGYRQNYLVRDQGFYVSLEVAYPLYGGEPGSKHGLFLVPFTDYGGASNQGEKTSYLQSIGIGAEWHYSTFSSAFYWAQRLGDYDLPKGTPYDAQDNGIYFQVNWRSF